MTTQNERRRAAISAAWTPERRAAHSLTMRAKKAAGVLWGFAALPECLLKEIAQAGGKAVQAKGTGHRWTSDEARAAGRKGGLVGHGGRRRTA